MAAAGTTIQFNLLGERLKAVGYDVATYDFPRYDMESSHFVKQYLNGNYGEAAQISPYTSSLFFALDRYEASKDILKDLEAGKIVLANRYVGSNMAHQGSKFGDPVEQRGFFVWNDNLEYELLKLPRPDTNLFLRIPADVSYDSIEKNAAGNHTKMTRDQHKDDADQLRRSVATYDLLCQLFPKDFSAIDCVKNGKLLSIPEISNLIWNKIKPLLPADKPKPGHSAVVTLGEPEQPVNKTANSDSIDKMTVPFLSASLQLRQAIETMYPGSTVPTITFWSESNYDFYAPQTLPKELKSAYKEIVQGLGAKYAKLLDGLRTYYEKQPSTKGLDLRGIGYLVRPVTPLCAVMPFEAVIEKSEVLPLTRRLLESDQPEAQWAAKQLYLMARQVWPLDFKKSLETSDGLTPIGSIIAKLSPAALSASTDNQTVKLLEATPRQEFDLLADSIYPFSTLSLDEITQAVAEWPYQQKYDSLRRAASQVNVLREVNYKLDVISDQITLNDLAIITGLQQIQVQAVSPRYGFEVPQVFEDANLDDLYNECFDESLRLYSLLQAAGRDDLAGYAALMGHRVRWQLNASAADLYAALEHRSPISGPLLDRIIESTSEAHSLLWDVLKSAGVRGSGPIAQSRNRVKPYHQRHKRRSKPKK